MIKRQVPAPQPIFIGIVGASGAGKTTLCRMLKRQSRQYEHVKLDNYFKNPKSFPKKHGYCNWESPSNIKFSLLLRHLKMLRRGSMVRAHSFPTSEKAKPKPLILQPKKYVLVEGFLLFTDKQVRDILDIKIYLDMPPELMAKRRLIRFKNKQLSDYDMKVAIPEFLKTGVKQKKFADHVIQAHKPQTKVLEEVKNIISEYDT